MVDSLTPDSGSLAKQFGIDLPSPEQQLKIDCKNDQQVSLWVKRDDLLHPIISGNKWRKLQHTLQNIDSHNVASLISFGGGHSNHLHALAYCCQRLSIPFVAMVRGDYSANLTPTLRDMLNWGTQIEYLDRLTYQRKDQAEFLLQLNARFPNSLVIPEGGSDHPALAGITSMIDELQNSYDVIITPVASGATMAGLVKEQPNHQSNVIGVAVLKGQGYLEKLVERFLSHEQAAQPNHRGMAQPSWHIEHDYHHGGYAKRSPALLNFCQQFSQNTQIPVEPVYSGKLFYAVMQMIQHNQFKPQQKILALHTGGLQGARNSMDTHHKTPDNNRDK